MRPHRWGGAGDTEETGHRANLGRRLLTVTYPTDSPFRGVKKVHYWAARSTGGEFTPAVRSTS